MMEVHFWRRIFILLMCALAIYVLIHVWSITIPFILGFSMAYLVYPIVDYFVIFGFRRDRIVLVFYALLLIVFFTVVLVVLPLLYRETMLFIQQLPQYAQSLDQTIQQLNSNIQSHLVSLLGAKAKSFSIPFNTEKFVTSSLKTLPENLINIAHGLAWIVIIPFVCFFSLSQGKKWINSLFQWTPSRYVESLLGMMAEINAALGGYVRGQMLDAFCVGLLTCLGLSILGIEGAIFLGCLTGLFNVVPFMAPVVGGALALFVGLVQQQSPSILMGIVILYVGVRIFDDFVFVPFVIGHSVQLHPIAMLFSVLAGFEIAGLMGLVFAIPVAAVIKVILGVFLSGRDHKTLDSNHIYS